MKLVRYGRRTEPGVLARMGVVVADAYLADLRAGHARFLVEERGNPKGEDIAAIFMPPYITQFLHLGESGWEALAETHAWLAELVHREPDSVGMRGEQLFLPIDECRLYAPVRPSKLIAIGRNYPEVTRQPGREAGRVPTGFIKVPSTIVGHGRDILKPRVTRELDCETELAVVIGRQCKHVSAERAFEVIAGYTIVNDVTARDIGKTEREGGQLLLGKCFDTFAPIGPWLVTRDEIPNPDDLDLRTRVNGEVRQSGNTAHMLNAIPKLIEYLSHMTLMPGDIISTGSPGPTISLSHRPLEAGDVVECEVEHIGVLRNAIVDEPD
jgi:2-keto-4-pentenoate hydratase/2-oxohepta-3-ene-1,7-dioic acid hydratase in catechol pathway